MSLEGTSQYLIFFMEIDTNEWKCLRILLLFGCDQESPNLVRSGRSVS